MSAGCHQVGSDKNRLTLSRLFNGGDGTRFEELSSPRAGFGKLPLKQVADLYFKQKATDHSPETVARERRIFRRVEEYFGSDTRVKSIHPWLVEQYQQERSKEISPTMKRKITARTINYEMQLLRGVMLHAGCWRGDLAVYYKPLRQTKSQRGQAASDNQLARIIETAKKNENRRRNGRDDGK